MATRLSRPWLVRWLKLDAQGAVPVTSLVVTARGGLQLQQSEKASIVNIVRSFIRFGTNYQTCGHGQSVVAKSVNEAPREPWTSKGGSHGWWRTPSGIACNQPKRPFQLHLFLFYFNLQIWHYIPCPWSSSPSPALLSKSLDLAIHGRMCFGVVLLVYGCHQCRAMPAKKTPERGTSGHGWRLD